MCHFRTRLLLSFILWSVGGLWTACPSPGCNLKVEATSATPRVGVVSSPPKASAPPRVEPLRLNPGRGRPRSLKSGVVHSYSFNLRPGEFLRLIFDQQDVDIRVDVIDPRRRKILEVDTLNSIHGPEDVPFVAELSGAHEVRISADKGGSYSARVATRRLATSRDRLRAASALAYFRGEEARLSRRPLSEVESYYNEAARLAGQVGEAAHRADAYYRLGKLQCDSRRWSTGQDSYVHSLALYEDIGNLPQQATVLNEVGRALNMLGKTEQAAEAFRGSIERARMACYEGIEATASLELGLLQLERGEVGPALRNLEGALTLSRKAKKTSLEVKALNGCGRVYTFIGEVGRALEFHGEALKRLSEVQDDQIKAETLVHIGDAYREADQYPLSRSYYLDGLELLRKLRSLDDQAKVLNNLGLTYFNNQQYQDALDAFLQARQIFHELKQSEYESICWANVGWVQISLKKIPQAIQALESSLLMSQKLSRRPAESAAYFGLAWAERRRHNFIAARRNAQRAVDIVEVMRSEVGSPSLRQSLLASRANFYDLLVDILMEQHRIRPAEGNDVKALEASEGERARSLLESLGNRSAPPLLSLSAIQRQVLDDQTILLEYHLGEERSFLWVVTTESYASFELPSRLKIELLAREVYELLKKSDGREVLPSAARKARALSEMLLGPVTGRLGKKRLLIVAPPALQYIPFAALPDLTVSEPGNSDFLWPTPLIVGHEIVSAPSASVIAALRATRAGRKMAKHLLAMLADPVYERSDERLKSVAPRLGREPSGIDLTVGFKRLKHSQEEAEAIIRMAGRQNVLELTGFDANQDRVLDGSLSLYKYLHFSAHGKSNAQHPELSSIVLSAFNDQGLPRAPFLFAKDIQTLGLSADLVVLSACGTGLGQEVLGEGLVGLTQAFLSGGALSVVVSLWDVDDLATSEIMPGFYSNLLKGGLKPSAALRQAQISMWRQLRWNAPSYWAGFIEQGEWR
jgi:CHAT domain-containing protein